MEKGIPSDMYREHIMDLYKNPQNFGIMKNPTHKKTEYNSLCGDEITVQLKVKDGKVKDVKFNGSGCVISMVSASLITEKIREMPIEEIKKLNNKDILELLKIRISPARIKCALLPLEATKRALK
ncbi:MAG TPA: iron-sulfur cluster assembly scaffold protein [Candidatus Pacearchaeota archaeon]|nr:iron-sulfur cluster assembly scaffold protein [Candidatus Pacearchaeota archaeon]